MKKSTKIISITLTSLVLVLFGSGYLFVHSIYKQRTCEWANIDNIEVHAKVDIPKIKNCDCTYEKDQNVKKAWFNIDKSQVDMVRYIERNRLERLTSDTQFSSGNFLTLQTNVTALNSGGMYYREGSDDGENWKILLDNNTGKLWVTLQYKD